MTDTSQGTRKGGCVFPAPRLHSRSGGGLGCGTTRETRASSPCERERSAAGPVRAPVRASGGERRRKEKGAGEGGGSRSAAMQRGAESRARRPGSAPPPRRCCNAGVSTAPRRAGPGRASRAVPRPNRSRLRLSPAFSPPFRFPPAPAGTAGRCLPRRDAAGRCPRDLPFAPCLPRGGGLGLPPVLDARGLRQRSPWPPQLPVSSLRLPPTPGPPRSPLCLLHRRGAGPGSLP